MIWDLKSFNMKEPNVDEKEWAMGFWINIIAMPSISKGAYADFKESYGS
jgi:hypothetical protein